MVAANISENKDITAEINEILESVRPSLQNHGGDATLREVRDDVVYLDLHGACQGCPMSEVTFGMMVEEAIKQRLPHIREVIF